MKERYPEGWYFECDIQNPLFEKLMDSFNIYHDSNYGGNCGEYYGKNPTYKTDITLKKWTTSEKPFTDSGCKRLTMEEAYYLLSPKPEMYELY